MNTNTPSFPPHGYQGPKPGTIRNLNEHLREHDLMLIPTTTTRIPSRKKSSGTPRSNHSLDSRNNSVSSNGSQAKLPEMIEYQITSRSGTLSRPEIGLKLDYAAGVDKAAQAGCASSGAGSFESEVIEVRIEDEDDDSEEDDEEEEDEQDVVMEDSQEAAIVDSQENGSSFNPSFTVDGAGGEGMRTRGLANPCKGSSAGAMRDIPHKNGSAVSLDDSGLVEKMVHRATGEGKSHDPLLDGDDDSEGSKRKKRKLRNLRRRRQGRS